MTVGDFARILEGEKKFIEKDGKEWVTTDGLARIRLGDEYW